MATGVLVIVSIGLLAACLRIWMEFTQRMGQLQSEFANTRELVENHTEALEDARTKVDDIKAEYENMLKERSDLESQVNERRQELTALEERRERARPAHLRVDMSEEESEEDKLF